MLDKSDIDLDRAWELSARAVTALNSWFIANKWSFKINSEDTAEQYEIDGLSSYTLNGVGKFFIAKLTQDSAAPFAARCATVELFSAGLQSGTLFFQTEDVFVKKTKTQDGATKTILSLDTEKMIALFDLLYERHLQVFLAMHEEMMAPVSQINSNLGEPPAPRLPVP